MVVVGWATGSAVVVSVGASVVVLARVIVVMSSEQAAAKSTAKAKDSPKSEKKLYLRRTMLILDIKPVHYKAYFSTQPKLEALLEDLPREICQNIYSESLPKRGPPGARTQHLEVKSLLLYPMS